MRCVLVSHTHWDREWYRTFEAFRARLVDSVDRVLELCEADPEYRFLLDGQSAVLEDYLAIRPEREPSLARACARGQVAIGPWYVQPDSLLPSGEAHVRNLLEGRRAGERVGPVSRVAYTPDSFGHPAQLPQILSGFGLETFVYWRGNGDEIDELPAEYAWEAPDGSAVRACHLARGYFAAGSLPRDAEVAAERLRRLAEDLAKQTRSDQVLLMNGADHAPPDRNTREVAEALAKQTGWSVDRGLLEDFAARLPSGLPRHGGELLGARIANLLPGVWSTRTALKLRNRRCEALLEGWAEPWAAVARHLGLADERPALRLAWRSLLQNQAHDSICGCSRDRVHEQMIGRYDASEELARETTVRSLERLAGLEPERETPWRDEIDVAVFNPSPHRRSDVVTLRLDPIPYWIFEGDDSGVHPLLRRDRERPGFSVDGAPTRLVETRESGRVQLSPRRPALDLEFVARDVAPFGWRRFRLERAARVDDERDTGREIEVEGVAVSAQPDGALDVRFGERRFSGLAALEDLGDRGDTYDFDPVLEPASELERVHVERTRHASGIQSLVITRTLRVPLRLADDRRRRSETTTRLELALEARLAPGLERVDLRLRLDNPAEDHRLRLLFPTGRPAARFEAASTFDVASRETAPRDASQWIHPAPSTFPHQGWIHANGLCVVAPGLAEGEVTTDGTIAVTLLRAVGWLSRHDLDTRPLPAGPAVHTPGAQCPGKLEARLWLLPRVDPRGARDAELGLLAVAAGERRDSQLWPDGEPLVELEPRELELCAFKPAEAGPGCVLRVLNPTDVEREARIRIGLPVERARAVRLDETPADEPVELREGVLRLPVPPRALRSVLLV
jgi:alpha-mannosidase